MTKTVFDNHGTAHAFASRSQESGRSANGNFYFEGDTLYSYGSHFPICRFYGDVLLFTTDSYSVSTSAHITIAESATRQFEKVYLPDLGKILPLIKIDSKDFKRREAIKLIDDWAGRIAKIEDKMSRMRAEWKINSARADIRVLEQAAYFVWVSICRGRGNPFSVVSKATKAEKLARVKRNFTLARETLESNLEREPELLVSIMNRAKEKAFEGNDYHIRSFKENTMRSVGNVYVDAIGPLEAKEAKRAMGAKWVKETLALQETRDAKFEPLNTALQTILNECDAKIAEMNAEKIEQWVSGEIHHISHSVPMTLRVVDDELQTSEGARVPLSEAKTLTRAAILCRKAGKEWKRNGEKKPVGMFQTDKITAQGDLRVGCHLIPWAAIVDCVNRFVPELAESVNAAN